MLDHLNRSKDLTFSSGYLNRLFNHIQRITDEQSLALREASEQMALILSDNCRLHTFGCGHSALTAAEICYRAGGIAAVNFLGLLPGEAGFIAATEAESDEDYAKSLVQAGQVEANDMVVIISHSGSSPLILAVLHEIQGAGAHVMALTSHHHTPLAKKANSTIITACPGDDCLLESRGFRFASLSSLVGGILLNTLITSAIEILLAKGKAPLLFKSVHIPGGPMHNRDIINKLGKRIPSWWRNAPVKKGNQ